MTPIQVLTRWPSATLNSCWIIYFAYLTTVSPDLDCFNSSQFKDHGRYCPGKRRRDAIWRDLQAIKMDGHEYYDEIKMDESECFQKDTLV